MRALSCAIVICGAALQGLAQAPPPSAAAAGRRPDQPPVFRVATRLVQFSVVVHDRDGRPVTDLKKEDFTRTERGKPQPIAFLSMESADRPPARPAAPSPHIFSNVFAERSGVPTSIMVILLDLLNTRWADQQYARKALITFLGQIQPDRIAIYTLGERSLTVLHDYTTDAASLVARLKRARGEIPSQLEASTLDPDSQQELRDLDLSELADANQREADFFTGGRVERRLATLEAIAQHLSGLPGRKNLIWLSGGFPLTIGYDEFPTIGSSRDRRTFTSEMDATVRALNNSGIAVYPVDARGLMVLPGFDATSRGTVRRAPVTGSRLGPILENIDTMRELADRTGGRAAYNTNDLPRAIRRAIDDARVTYTIGYYPIDQAEDGRFREIKVKVNRPHVDVRHRKGYFALKPSDATVERRESELRDAVWSPLEATAVAIAAQVDFIDAPEAAALDVILRIDARAEHEGGSTMTLDGTLEQLKALGNEKVRAHNTKYGAGDDQFGVKHGDIRVLTTRIRTDQKLALSLWGTGNVDAQLLATLLIKPKDLSAKDVDRMVRSIAFAHVADWLIAYVVTQHPDKETLRQEWMSTDDRWAACAGWSLTAERVVRSPEGLDFTALLDRIESEMPNADPVVQWTMNGTLG